MQSNIFKGLKLKSIIQTYETSVKIQRSEFIAFLYPIIDVAHIKETLAEHNNKYKDSTHNCYAYIIGKKQETQYYSDQGEPSGTAGKPILNTLLRYNLTNVLAIVTRYYGGVKLGVRGLIDAYSEAVELAVLKAELIDYHPTREIEIVCEYSALEQIRHNLLKFEAELVASDYSVKIRCKIIYPEVFDADIQNLISDLTQKHQLSIIRTEDKQ
jgi:uncharacterized YigZ family protein